MPWTGYPEIRQYIRVHPCPSVAKIYFTSKLEIECSKSVKFSLNNYHRSASI